MLVRFPQDESDGNKKLSRLHWITSQQDQHVCAVKVHFLQDDVIRVHQSRVKSVLQTFLPDANGMEVDIVAPVINEYLVDVPSATSTDHNYRYVPSPDGDQDIRDIVCIR